jgi:hypothetical protein
MNKIEKFWLIFGIILISISVIGSIILSFIKNIPR